mmetsp:Transcript_28484/g.63570  ORF Transcript_28484/g.63570 Transcript_28484/m.63570 type:complete len:256 (-) Transcript_28484:250-1017(-)
MIYRAWYYILLVSDIFIRERAHSCAQCFLQCALVSSSGQLLGSKLGNKINSFPIVIRMNSAPIKKFESDVGNRTDVRFIGNRKALAQWKILENTTSFAVLRSHGKKRGAFSEGDAVSLRNETGLETFVAPECGGNSIAQKKMKGRDLSTGFVTVAYFSNLCHNLTLFGFVTREPNAPYHYFENYNNDTEAMHFANRKANRAGHAFEIEREFYLNSAVDPSAFSLQLRTNNMKQVCPMSNRTSPSPELCNLVLKRR